MKAKLIIAFAGVALAAAAAAGGAMWYMKPAPAAGAVAAEGEVVSGDDGGRADPVVQPVGDEAFGAHRRHRAIERQYDRAIDPERVE